MVAKRDESSRLTYAETACAGSDLVSPAEALAAMLAHIEVVSDTENIPVLAGAGRIIPHECRSAIALPRFDNAAMDGFAIHGDDIAAHAPLNLRISGNVAAGERPAELRPGETLAINTGARIPPGTGAVVEHERVAVIDHHVVLDAPPATGRNIRRAGEDIKPNDLILAPGTILDERHIALLSACGITEIPVRRRLRIGILSTGNELIPHGTIPEHGQVVDVNRRLLATLVGFAGTVDDLGIAKDTLADLTARLSQAKNLDLLITSGGVAGSVADLVPEAMTRLGGSTTTMKLALKPGKPVGFSRLGSCAAVHLAGNPMAAAAGGLLLARPLALAMIGATDRTDSRPAYFVQPVPHRAGRMELLPVRVVGYDHEGRTMLTALGRGGSANLAPLAAADGMAEIPAHMDMVQPREKVIFHSFFHSAFAPRQGLWRTL